MASGTPSGWEWSIAPGWEAGAFKRPLHTLQRVSIGRSWLCDEAFVNIPELRSSRGSRLVHTSCAGGGVVAPCHPQASPEVSLPSAVLNGILYDQLEK